MIMKKYKWFANSNDGSFEDESEESFTSKEECYNDMRNSALEKMKWNTEWEDVDDDGTLGYKVHFSKNKIIHESYSGMYTYEIIEINGMKTLELTQDACQLIKDALISQIEMWEYHNKIIYMNEIDDVAQKYIDKNNTKIGELKTLLDYINS